MAQTFPCPNPVCTHAFTPDAVRGAASLTCPRCGLVFDFRSPPGSKPVVPVAKSPVPPPRAAPSKPKLAPVAAPPPPPAPTTVTPTAYPVAQPVVAAPPVARPVGDDNPVGTTFPPPVPDAPAASADLAFDQSSTGAAAGFRRRPPRRKRRGLSGILVGVVAVLALPVICGGLVGAAGWYLGYFQGESVQDIPDVPDPAAAGNFTYRKPGPAWQQDKDLQLKLKLHFAMKRAQPDDHFALYFRDYKTRSPSEAELREEAVTRLKAYLPETPEMELRPAGDKATLGGRPARVLDFVGADDKSVLMNGECYFLTFQGYAYWFFTWGPASEVDAIKPEWEKVRQGFNLGNNRPGWQETPRVTEVARSSSGSKLRYQLNAVKGLWKAEALDTVETRAQFDKADLVLVGTYPGDPKATVRAASSTTAQVVILEDKPKELPDAIATARAFLLERLKGKSEGGEYTYPNTKVDFVQDKTLRSIDDPIGKGMAKGQVLKLLVENDKDRYRFVVLRVMNLPQGVVVLWMECDNRFRDYWDPEFMALLETFEFTK